MLRTISRFNKNTLVVFSVRFSEGKDISFVMLEKKSLSVI